VNLYLVVEAWRVLLWLESELGLAGLGSEFDVAGSESGSKVICFL
jgi:hypothetical protein